MELLPVEENLLINQDSIGEKNTDNNMKAIDNTKKDEKYKGKEIITETEKENNETNEQNITNTKTDDNESVNSEDSFLSEDMEKACKIKIERTQLNDRSTLTRTAINQNIKTNNEKGIKVKIVDTVLKKCHRCHAEDLVISFPVAKKQREISKRKARDFEKYWQLYKRQRSQLYKSLMGGINMRTSYSDAVKNNIYRKAKNNIMKKNDITNENIMNKLLEIQQYIKEIKDQVKDIDENMGLVKTYCAYEILNDEEAGEMEICDDENEEINEKEKSKTQITNNKKEGKEMEKTINYIYETVKTLLEEIKHWHD
ncbi:11664_t:CDS:2 [Diversispora eburnea]|uniref:11664_t:CDS:1 n=1 Tax=Diversispora eburnea TaxID=1213867 RepID=A0A9N9BHV4_9GLOM|nr:11664_t:CDS:2 [Diversispora eburnea]